MSHEVNPQNSTLESHGTAVVDPLQVPFLEAIPEADAVVDESADAVMDDVFEDVERILKEGGLPNDVAPPPPKPNPLTSLAGSLMPSLLAPRSAPPEESALQELDDLTDGDDVDELAALATEGGDLAPLESTPSDAPRVTQKSFDQLLLTLAGISVLLTGGLWLMAQIFWKESPTVVATGATEELAVVSEADREFMNYLGRSLNVIDRKVEVAQETATVTGNTDLPDVSVAANLAEPPPTVLDRVYVPVYQTPQGTAPATVAPVPPVNAPTVAVSPTAPAPAPAPAPSPDPSAPVPNIAASPNHELVGVLNLGDRSAALFEVNGSVQRIELGERIGSSGWSLVSVEAGGEAIIRRNGEVRSVYVGQEF